MGVARVFARCRRVHLIITARSKRARGRIQSLWRCANVHSPTLSRALVPSESTTQCHCIHQVSSGPMRFFAEKAVICIRKHRPNSPVLLPRTPVLWSSRLTFVEGLSSRKRFHKNDWAVSTSTIFYLWVEGYSSMTSFDAETDTKVSIIIIVTNARRDSWRSIRIRQCSYTILLI